MAKGFSVLFNKLGGSLGNITAVNQPDGSVVVKSKITDMTNPRTEGQTRQRTKFASVQRLAILILAFINSWYTRNKPTHSFFNSFMQDRLNDLSEVADPNLDDIMRAGNVTKGPLYPISAKQNLVQATVGGNGVITAEVSFDYDPLSNNQDGTDLIGWIAVDSNGENYVEQLTTTLREEGEVAMAFPQAAGGEWYISIFAVNEAKTKQTTSQFTVKIDNNGVATDL